jgi:hypothetical protein
VRLLSTALLLAVFTGLAGCSDDSTGPVVPSTTSLTVDASTNWAYVRLGPDSPRLVTVTNATTSSDWDMAFLGTNVMVNGGASGPGNVSAACICAATEPTTAQLQAMTATTELARFDGVTTSNIPAENLFVRDTLAPVVAAWFTGTPGGTLAPVTTSTWLIREGATAFTFTKLRITQIRNSTATSAGEITFQYATQAATGAAFGPVQTVTVQVPANAPVYYDFTTGAVTTSANWDMRFNGFFIQLNGGASGTGTVRGAAAGNNPTFDAFTAAIAQSVPSQVFTADSFAGQFLRKLWYRYNITGTDNQIWPTYDVYIIRRGTEVYKVQLTGYYSTAGAARNITIRSARLR